MIDTDKIAESVLPLDGPYDPDAVNAAASLIGELVRHLNHATLPHNAGESLPIPQVIDQIAGSLAGAAARSQQLLQQLAQRLDTMGSDERLRVDQMGPPLGPLEAASVAGIHLEDAANSLDPVRSDLAEACSYTTRLAWNAGNDD